MPFSVKPSTVIKFLFTSLQFFLVGNKRYIHVTIPIPFSSFLSGWKQNLSCTGRIQTGRVDRPRAVKVEAGAGGSKDVRGQRRLEVAEPVL